MSQPLRKRGINVPTSIYDSGIHKNVDDIHYNNSTFRPRRSTKLSRYISSIKLGHLMLVSFLWLITLFYFQRIKPGHAIDECEWSKWEHFGTDAEPHRVLLIADPQIVDDHTYPSRPRWIQYITKKISDNYMSINYKHMQEKLRPHSTIFLGDLFDGGREWHDDKKWYDEWKRFNRMFPSYPNRKFYYNILGNHDAGWDKTMNRTILDRFKVIFGDSNDYQNIGNHTFLFLDTIALSATNNNDSSIVEEARYYLNNLTESFLPELDSIQVSKNQNLFPRVLLTHVPFFRDPAQQPCRGPRENKKPFPLVNGGTFQTVLFPDLSNELLNKLQPEIIFSGDDHDYCEIDHMYIVNKKRAGADTSNKQTREITVKSFSMNMGVRYPAAQLLSLYNPLDRPVSQTYQTEICYPYAPFVTLYSYGFLLLVTIIHWVLVSICPSTFIKIQLALYKCFKHLLPKSLISKYSSMGGIYTDKKYEDDLNTPFSPESLKFYEDGYDLERITLGKGLKPRDLRGFWVNFTTQLLVIYLLFSYFYITV